MENVKARLMRSLPAAENSVIPETVSTLDEKMVEKKEADESELIPYLTLFRHLVSETLPNKPQLLANKRSVNAAAMSQQKALIQPENEEKLKAALVEASKPGSKALLTADDVDQQAPKLATVKYAAASSPETSGKSVALPPVTAPTDALPAATGSLPAATGSLPVSTSSLPAAADEKKGKDAQSEDNGILPPGALGISGTPQSDISVKSKAEHLHAHQLKQAEQDVSSILQKSEASTRPEHGETRITYTFRRWDASNRHAVELTLPKDQLTQPLIMAPTTREVRERIDIARDMPGAPVFSLREEGEQHSNRRNAWRFYDEEEA